MAYDTQLADRVRSALSGRSGVAEKTLFGGLTFTINGNMVASVNSQGFSLRVGKKYDEALKMPGVKAKMLGTKAMNGMVVAEESRYSTDDGLKEILDLAADEVASLPAKVK